VAAHADGRRVRLFSRDGALWFLCEGPRDLTVTLEPGWVSPSYGVKRPATVIQCTTDGPAPIVLSYQFSESEPSCVKSF
jgi:hypothetical protein